MIEERDDVRTLCCVFFFFCLTASPLRSLYKWFTAPLFKRLTNKQRKKLKFSKTRVLHPRRRGCSRNAVDQSTKIRFGNPRPFYFVQNVDSILSKKYILNEAEIMRASDRSNVAQHSLFCFFFYRRVTLCTGSTFRKNHSLTGSFALCCHLLLYFLISFPF